MENNSWSLKNFENLIEIGKGSFSKVYQAIETRTKKPVALKVIQIDSAKKINYLNRVM
jgi:serine/threonine protein kinase